MTPGELAKIRAAVADAAAALFAREDNENLTAEMLGEELAEAVVDTVISSYEEIQAKAYNLIVLGHFRLDDDTSYVAAVGPLSTRAKMRAKEVGERFAWDYKTRRGTGKYTLVPLVRNPSEAWDAARAASVRVLTQELAPRGALSLDPYGPACTCGLDTTVLQEQGKYFICPRHPEGRDSGTEGPAQPGTGSAG